MVGSESDIIWEEVTLNGNRAARDQFYHWRYILGQPGFNVKAKRQRAKRKNDPDLIYEYAGQIFCEMLGQTCYKEFYENRQMEYQEVLPSNGQSNAI